MQPDHRRADAICFDKDGTLFDFATTWNGWAGQVIADLAKGDADVAARIALSCGYDLEARRILPGSPIVAATNREVAESMAAGVPDRDIAEIETYLTMSASHAPLAPAVPLVPFLQGLAGQGVALGVMTNDTEFGARAHLSSAGVLDLFDFVAGFDSGHGAKPSPDPLLAFCLAVAATPERSVMVGDSRHDLIAGRAAGMQTVGVLTGMAELADLAPFADVVLPDIGHLPLWLTS